MSGETLDGADKLTHLTRSDLDECEHALGLVERVDALEDGVFETDDGVSIDLDGEDARAVRLVHDLLELSLTAVERRRD